MCIAVAYARVQRICTILVLSSLAAFLFPISLSLAQTELADERWHSLETENFRIIGQASARQIQGIGTALENWRQFVASILPVANPLPTAAVPNYVYLFDELDDMAGFSIAADPGFFYATPRANYMAFVADDAESLRLALHHYSHFLLRNFADLRLPRWYEEGLSAYVSRINVRDGEARFEQYNSRNNEALARISESFSMERLLYRVDALASPRVLQIANLKAESLYYFLQHAYLEEGFSDRRQQLGNYLQALLGGRNPRFAFDQSFDVTTVELDAEFNRFLQQDSRPRIEFSNVASSPVVSAEVERLTGVELAISLGELALNGGKPETAQAYFELSMDTENDTEPGNARAYSGLGDALRFQDLNGGDQEIAALFQQALDRGPDNVNIVLDFGEYWEAELEDCDKTYSEARRQQIMADIERSFTRALQMAPELPEVHLAMGEYFLLPGQDWRAGQNHQQRAFELLPADTFILEQAVRYAIADGDYQRAQRLIAELAEPMHFFGEPGYVTDLRERLLRHQRGEAYDACAA